MLEAASSTKDVAPVTGQRVTLTAIQAAKSSTAAPQHAEVVQLSMFPEESIRRRVDGAAPNWNEVVTMHRHTRRYRS